MNIFDLKLGKLEKSLKIEDFELRKDGFIYKPYKITFYSFKLLDEFALKLVLNHDASKRIGFIAQTITKDLRELLEAKKISYIIPDKAAYLFSPEAELRIKIHSELKSSFPFTKIFSPAGLEIFDAIITLPRSEMLNVSFFKLCQDHQLNQPKMSQISKATGTKTPLALKDWILSQETHWWSDAFADTKARRQLTPFETDLSLVSMTMSISEIARELRKSDLWPNKVFYSGPELLKRAGYLKDPNFYICCEPGIEDTLMKKFRLIPTGKSATKASIKVSILRKSFESEAIFSKISQKGVHRYNTLRMLWGTQSEDERIQESRFAALRNYLNESN